MRLDSTPRAPTDQALTSILGMEIVSSGSTSPDQRIFIPFLFPGDEYVLGSVRTMDISLFFDRSIAKKRSRTRLQPRLGLERG